MILFIFQLAERESTNDFLNTFRPTGKCQFVDMSNVIKIHYRNNMYITPPSTNRIVKVEWEGIEKQRYTKAVVFNIIITKGREEEKKEDEQLFLWLFQQTNNPIRNKRIEPMKNTIMFIFCFFLLLYHRLHISFVITREQYHNDIQQLRHKTSGKLQIFYSTN